MTLSKPEHTFAIAGRDIGPDTAPYLIAEMSGNHNHDIDRAIAIIDAAADSGADAVKLQTYTADTMTLDVDAPDFRIEDEKSLWNGRNLYDLYTQAHTPWDWHGPLFEHAKSRGIQIFSTPFDPTSVDFLEDLGAPAYKVASFEMTDLRLIRKIAETGKPMIISTGMGSVAEVAQTVETARAAGAKDIIVLKCTSTYPATPANSHLATIPNMRDTFDCAIGLSDHTLGCGVAVAAVAMGAPLVEKHFTLRRADGGVDSAFSMEPVEWRMMREECDRAWQAMGEITYGGTKDEENSRIFRRSLYIAQDVKAGDELTPENMRIVRPGYGLEPKFYETLLGKRVARDAEKGTRVDWSLLVPEA